MSESTNIRTEEVQKFLEEADRRATVANQQRLEGVRFKTATTKTINGGQFLITPEFLMAVRTMVESGEMKTILPDNHGILIRIDDLPGFLDDIANMYAEAVNETYFRQRRIRKSRSAKHAVEQDLNADKPPIRGREE